MAVPQIISRSSCLISGRAPTCLARSLAIRAKIPAQRRQLVTTVKLWQETIETQSRGPEVPLTSFTSEPKGSHARSVALLKVNKRAVRKDIEELVRSKGLDVTRMQFRLDRFTLQNDGRCFIEFAHEDQAHKAVRELNGTEFMHNEVVAAPLKEDFVWGATGANDKGKDYSPRFFYENETSVSEALKPLLEGRRMMFSVQTPAWGKPNSSAGHNSLATQVVEETFGKYGIETISALQPFWGDKQRLPRMLCFLDFKTKGGADQAVQEVHDTEIQGRKVWLRLSVLAPWRAHQVGKLDQALLSRLQEQELASKEPYEDNFLDSDRRRGKENYKKNKDARTQKRRAERAGEAN